MMGIQPVRTEKSLKDAENGRFTFLVDVASSKYQVKHMVEQLFKVTVTRVQTAKLAGKVRRFGRRYQTLAARKKALVYLKKGQTIGLFGTEKREKGWKSK